MSAQEQMGTLSRDEQRLIQLTAADMLAWLDAQKSYFEIGPLGDGASIRWCAERGAWNVQRWTGPDFLLNKDCATLREALTLLIEYQRGNVADWQ